VPIGRQRRDEDQHNVMTVKDKSAFKELVLGGINKKPRKLKPLDSNHASEVSSAAFLSARAIREKYIADRKLKMEEKRKADVESLQRALKWRIQEAHAERDKREAARLKAIKTEQESFVVEVDTFLENKAEQTHLQCKELHRLWEKEVYKKIEGQIASRVGDMSEEDIHDRLCHQMEQYVEACDSKPNGLFRDIIIESEYNPFESKKATVKVDARPRSKTCWNGVKDPLNEQIEKVMEIHQDKSATEMPIKGKNPGKATLPLKDWATGVIEDTPHGFAFKAFEKSISEMALTAEEKQKRAKRNVSTLSMDHYGYAKGKEAVQAECPAGKRCFPGWKPGERANSKAEDEAC